LTASAQAPRVSQLPVQEPTKFDLVINLEAAKALGIAIPQSVLLQADRVIP
jgi:putative ABC transport system substrate-binding protein